MSDNPGINAALFNFCHMVDDGPRNAPAAERVQRDPEDLKWLREALASVEEPERIVKRLLTTIQQEDRSDAEILEALEELSDMVEDMNWAIEFALMNGHQIVIRMLEENPKARQNSEIRTQLAMIIAHAAQNNDKVQEAFNSVKWADVLVPKLRAEEDKGALAALLHACSCMCRECDEGSAAFLAARGLDVVQAFLSPSATEKINEKIALRILFLVHYFAQVGISSEALVENTCYQVTSQSTEVSVAAAKAVNALVKKSPSVIPRVAKKVAGTHLEGLNGLARDDPREELRRTVKSGKS